MSSRDRIRALYQDEGPLVWQDSGLCAQTDPELFFPERGTNTAQRARKVCSNCPVRVECLSYALDMSENPHGIWGGTTERERARMRAVPYAAPAA